MLLKIAYTVKPNLKIISLVLNNAVFIFVFVSSHSRPLLVLGLIAASAKGSEAILKDRPDVYLNKYSIAHLNFFVNFKQKNKSDWKRVKPWNQVDARASHQPHVYDIRSPGDWQSITFINKQKKIPRFWPRGIFRFLGLLPSIKGSLAQFFVSVNPASGDRQGQDPNQHNFTYLDCCIILLLYGKY